MSSNENGENHSLAGGIKDLADQERASRFSFVQDYFDLRCSDLRSFPVARTVAASSAVPVVFNPVVIINHEGCNDSQWNRKMTAQANTNEEYSQMIKCLPSFSDKKKRKYNHFVDGGITDNMGLRAMTDVIVLSGGPGAMTGRIQMKIPRHIVFLPVNASTEHKFNMDKTTEQPSMLAAMNAMTDGQLHRYNAATVDKTKESPDTWAAQISTPEHPDTSYFIQVSFENPTTAIKAVSE